MVDRILRDPVRVVGLDGVEPHIAVHIGAHAEVAVADIHII